MQKIILCEKCIEAICSRGEEIYVGGLEMDYEEAEETGTVCEWCGEPNDLYYCKY